MNTFTIEHGDNLFLIVAPNGEGSKAAHYCFWATMEHGGRVYAAYLSGETNDDDQPIDGNGDLASVYDITEFPNITAVPTILNEVEFDGETNRKGVSKDGLREIDCDKCDGDGFLYEKIPRWVAPPPEDDEDEDTIEVVPIG